MICRSTLRLWSAIWRQQNNATSPAEKISARFRSKAAVAQGLLYLCCPSDQPGSPRHRAQAVAFTRLSPARCTFGTFFDGQSGTSERQGMAEDAFDYDLLVIGSGPAGQRAAIQGAKLDKRVAIVERTAVLGGCSVNLGTIPSKTLREAVLELSGYRSREFYGASYTVKQNITIQDLLVRTNQVIHHEHRRHPPSADAQRCRADRRRRVVLPGRTRCASTMSTAARRARSRRGNDRHRHRHRDDPRPAYPVRRQPYLHQRRHSPSRPAAAHAGGGRRRRHRLRIRQHLRRARRPGDA